MFIKRNYIQRLADADYLSKPEDAYKEVIGHLYKTRRKNIPEQMQTRIKDEISIISEKKLAPYYLKAQDVVFLLWDVGQITGSRGTVGSSLIAFMLGITELNPLAPHYYCRYCGYSEFFYRDEVQSGFDLPLKTCPKCGKALVSDGHNIPFESLVGIDGNKIPDICLDIPKEYVNFDWFEIINSFAPTIDLCAKKSLDLISYLLNCTCVFSTDGIDLKDSKIYALFEKSNTEGVCEVDTDYVNNILSLVSVKKFSDLVKINGLAHGVGTWENNGEILIKDKVATLGELITSPEDVYFTLISYGFGRDEAYRNSQLVKKGRFEKESSQEDMQRLINAGVPEWYIESMKKIEYLFPKAQTVMNAINAARLAWFKVHYPTEFNAALLHVDADDF